MYQFLNFLRFSSKLLIILTLPLSIYFISELYSTYLMKEHIGLITEWKYYHELEASQPLARGDLLEFQRWYKLIPFQHWAVYEGRFFNTHFVIHFSGEIGLSDNATVRRDTLEEVAATSQMRINNEYDNISRPFHGEEIVKRARRDLGRQEYDIFTNNCEHFAIWCRNGVFISNQIAYYEPYLKRFVLPEQNNSWWQYRFLHPSEREKSWQKYFLHHISVILMIFKKEILLTCHLIILMFPHLFDRKLWSRFGIFRLARKLGFKGFLILAGEISFTMALMISKELDFWLSQFVGLVDISILLLYLTLSYVRINAILRSYNLPSSTPPSPKPVEIPLNDINCK